MKPYRCQLCGETYLGERLPDRCPYCGASEENLKPGALWIDYGEVEMDERSRENCKKALELEASNAGFYHCCAQQAQTQINQAIFKRLSKQEGEHAELIAEMLGVEEPDPAETDCPQEDEEKFAQAHAREDRAIKFYLQAAGEATEERVGYVFRHLAEVESEHLRLSNAAR